MILADQANVLPSQWRNMGHGGFWDIFASFAQGLNRFGKIDRIPGSDSSHDQMEATGPMHLILKRSISQFAEPAKEELACKGMKRLSFVQADQHTPPECFIAKILQQECCALQLSHLGECPGHLILTRIGREFAHEQARRNGSMTNR